MNAMQTNMNGAPIENLELQIRKKDGNTAYVNVHGVPILHDGVFAGVQVSMRDITAGKKAKKALIESEERYRSLSEASDDLIFVIDKNDRVSYVNKSAAEMLGASPNEIIGRERCVLFPPEISDGQQKAIRKVFRTGEGFRGTDALTFRGKMLWFDHSLLPVRDASGNITQVLGISRDVTEQKMTEDALRNRTEELDNRNRIISTLLDTVPIGIFMVDAPSGKPVLANQEATRLLGRGILPHATEQNLAGVYMAFRAGTRIPYPSEGMPIVRGMRGVTSHVDDMIVIQPDGTEVQLEIFGTPVFDRQNRVTGSLASFLDITQRKQEEHILKDTNKKLNLMNSITRHDMANQVTVIWGYAEIATGLISDNTVRDLLSRIKSAGSMITKMIEFTKEYEKLGMNLPGWYPISDIIAQLNPGDIAFTCTCNYTEIYADPMLERVLFTLAENAIPHGEHVTGISVRCEPVPDGLCIIVEDDGVGIPPDRKEFIFEKGYGRNTGYGLFLAREILAITGISIRETGEPGAGARFELHVPEGKYRRTS
jgi:PAS domain S-box-containing protein